MATSPSPLHPGLNADVSVGALHGRGDLHAGAAEVIQCDVILADHQQADRAVDAAVEGEVGFLGIDKVIFAVVGDRRSARSVLSAER